MNVPLLELRAIGKTYSPGHRRLFSARAPRPAPAVAEVSLSLASRETLALVGESGCGKSTLARMIVGLVPPSTGTILYRGREVGPRDSKYRHAVQMVFQDPSASLDPRLNAFQLVEEPLVIAGGFTAAERAVRVFAMLDRVGIAHAMAARFPHEFSGGQKQRIGIARALVTRPSLLILDEPVSALDVSIQAQIINLMHDLQDELGLSYLFISHDLAVVRHIADRIAVMQAGRIVELAGTAEVFESASNAYTRTLLASIPGVSNSVPAGCKLIRRLEIFSKASQVRIDPTTSTGLRSKKLSD